MQGGGEAIRLVRATRQRIGIRQPSAREDTFRAGGRNRGVKRGGWITG